MSTFISTVYRDLACAAAAAVISMIFAASFVQSTSVAPVTTSATQTVAGQAEHA
jgi:hypothetical protein